MEGSAWLGRSKYQPLVASGDRHAAPGCRWLGSQQEGMCVVGRTDGQNTCHEVHHATPPPSSTGGSPALGHRCHRVYGGGGVLDGPLPIGQARLEDRGTDWSLTYTTATQDNKYIDTQMGHPCYSSFKNVSRALRRKENSA